MHVRGGSQHADGDEGGGGGHVVGVRGQEEGAQLVAAARQHGAGTRRVLDEARELALRAQLGLVQGLSIDHVRGVAPAQTALRLLHEDGEDLFAETVVARQLRGHHRETHLGSADRQLHAQPLAQVQRGVCG